ncbi:carbohydrate-binding module family 50 protein [Cadophora sp. DSE1049]|nr:carbohydrate-binding module family 50 protein [Cadophora sp. DSE1049]
MDLSDEFAQSISTPSQNITTTQLLTWNPNLIGLCTNTTDQYVCTNAPGGTYIPPDVSNTTTSASDQQRGGGNGETPSPVQSGIPATCTEYAMAQSGDGCSSFSTLYDITLQALVSWNAVLGVAGANCTTLFWAGDYYCIGVSNPSSTSTTISSTPTIARSPTGAATPSPVQSGIDPQCTTYAEALSGTYYTKFATDNNITPAQLYVWNPILGVDGVSCNAQLQANTYYCVGAPFSSTTTAIHASTSSKTTAIATKTSVTAPGPTRTGITAKCNAFAEAVSGDGCWSFANEHGITTDELYAWNFILGSEGENCATQLWAGNYYCVGVST